jgi:hypothetical protein
MISYELAWQLRDAGLEWRPVERDIFALPGRELDGQVFVVSSLSALIQMYNGYPVVAFQGTAEWALDYVMLTEVLWLPQEHQLREALELLLAPGASLSLSRTPAGYRCEIGLAGEPRAFSGPDADSAYGQALLAALVAAG